MPYPLASLPRRRGSQGPRSIASGADSLDEAKAAFRVAGDLRNGINNIARLTFWSESCPSSACLRAWGL